MRQLNIIWQPNIQVATRFHSILSAKNNSEFSQRKACFRNQNFDSQEPSQLFTKFEISESKYYIAGIFVFRVLHIKVGDAEMKLCNEQHYKNLKSSINDLSRASSLGARCDGGAGIPHL